MSASPVFSSAALGRPFIFPACRCARENCSCGSTVGTSAPVPSSEAAKRRENTAHGESRGCELEIGKPQPGERSAIQSVRSSVVLAHLGALPKLAAAVTPASRLHVRPAPEMVSSGIRELDALTGGFPRGCLTEICGPASSGRTGILLSALARATRAGEVCALVDSSDALNPASAEAAGVEMERLLWVRCRKAVPSSRPVLSALPKHNFPNSNRSGISDHQHRDWEFSLEQVLKVTDLLLQSNGFGMIVLDLADIPVRSARRIPLASWFRFRQAIEHTPTVLLILEQQPIAGSCSSVLMKVSGKVSGVRSQVSGRKLSADSSRLSANQLGHTQLLDEFQITAELQRSRLDRKPPQSVTASFKSHASWAG